MVAMNPCPCGYLGSVTKECNCTAIEVDKYRRKLSGPILDRIDLQLNMHEISYSELEADNANNLSSDDMKMNIENAINFSISQGRGRNCGNIPDKGIRASCEFGKKEKSFLESAYIKLNLTPRSYMKIMKIARTIADFDNSNVVNCSHIAEALSYRCSNFDNGDW